MRISIVTISFNQARYLEAAIRSILDQDYDDIEYIVVDPGSTDGSREIIERYRDRISHMVLEPDDGPADGLNRGFGYASGDIYYYLNADDLLLPGALETVAAYFEAHPGVDVLLGHGYRIDSIGDRVTRIFSSPGWSLRGYALGVSNAVQQSTFFRASAYRAAGGFNAENRTCWDGELLVDMALNGARIEVLNDYLGAFRIYSESITGSGRFADACLRDMRRITERILGRGLEARDRREAAIRALLKYVRRPDHTFWKIRHRLVSAKPEQPESDRLNSQ